MPRPKRRKRAVVETPDVAEERATWSDYVAAVNAMCSPSTADAGRAEMDRITTVWDMFRVDAVGVDASLPWTLDGDCVIPNPLRQQN